MRGSIILGSFTVALIFAGAAFLFYTPDRAQQEVLGALSAQGLWHLQMEGEIKGSPFHADLVKRGEKVFLRLAYPPLKLLNNQWISFSDSSRGELFDQLQFTHRLTTFGELWRGVERYAFTFNEEVISRSEGLLPKAGELWFDKQSRLPSRLVLASLIGRLSYTDPFTKSDRLRPRPVQDVLVQLREMAEARNGKPKKVPSLSGGGTLEAFSHDFDEDGLSDALELFYGTDPANPDTDSDTHLDGEEIDKGYSPTGPGALN